MGCLARLAASGGGRVGLSPPRPSLCGTRCDHHDTWRGRLQVLCSTNLAPLSSSAGSTPPKQPGSPPHLTAEDRLDIMELCHRFDHALNNGQQESVGVFFAPDAEMHTPVISVKGVPNVVQYLKSVEHMAKGNRHLTANIMIEADLEQPGEARVMAYRLLHKACMPPVLLASGGIEDRVVLVDGQWKFASRRFIMDLPVH